MQYISMGDEPEQIKREESSKTLNMNVSKLSVLAYLTGFLPYLGWIGGLMLLLIEKDRRVRFHAYQSVGWFGGLAVLMTLLSFTEIFNRLNSILMVVMFVSWLMLILKTYEDKPIVLPWVGEWARKRIGA
jgi:uncharacterized membrane protein